MGVQDAIDQYLGAHTFRSPHTQRAYAHALGGFVTCCDELAAASGATLKDLHPDDFKQYVTWVQTKHYRASTQVLYATAVKQWLDWLVEAELIRWSASDIVQAKKALKALSERQAPPAAKVPRAEEVTAILEAAWHDEALSAVLHARNVALVQVLYCTGGRVQEIASLKVGDIDLKNREALVVGKGRKERKVFFSGTALTELQHYWSIRQDQAKASPALARHDAGAGNKIEPITPTGLRNVLARLRRLSGVSTFTPHSFRHYFAAQLLAETKDLALVQEALGHSDPRAVRIYAKTNLTTLKRAHKELFGSAPRAG